ncbi:Palmitoyltransferase PFA4 [Smittium mucronatum]|uniref:Palmitoyltransferase PFA4 n=1 Tax=Smittium mucronatum TaxID=133383 RepID=A0A1R0GLU9_9FUNG|nr:Palmitoyltransferase PFA4 [Smittium mucronatum]
MIVGVLFLFQSLLISRNTTSIERKEIKRVERLYYKTNTKVVYPYDLGITRNLKAVLGYPLYFFLIPWSIKGDGIDYEVSDGIESPVYWPPPEYHLEYPSGCNLGRKIIQSNSREGDPYLQKPYNATYKDHHEVSLLEGDSHDHGKHPKKLANNSHNPSSFDRSFKERIKRLSRNRKKEELSDGPSSGPESRTDSDAYISSDNSGKDIKYNSAGKGYLTSVLHHSDRNGGLYYNSSGSNASTVRMRSTNSINNADHSDSDENVPLTQIAQKLKKKTFKTF